VVGWPTSALWSDPPRTARSARRPRSDRISPFKRDRAGDDNALEPGARSRPLCPGVESAAIASRSMMRGSGLKNFVAPTAPRSGRDMKRQQEHGSRILRRMGVLPMAGRNSGARRCAITRKRPVLINQLLSARFLPQESYRRNFGLVSSSEHPQRFGDPSGVVGDTRIVRLRPNRVLPILLHVLLQVRGARGRPRSPLEVRSSARPETVKPRCARSTHRVLFRNPHQSRIVRPIRLGGAHAGPRSARGSRVLW